MSGLVKDADQAHSPPGPNGEGALRAGRPPTIAIFLHAAAGGGAEMAMINVANYLADNGAAIDLVLGRREGPYLARIAPSVRVVSLDAGRIRTMIGPLSAYVRANRPPVLISALASTDLVALLGKIRFRWPSKLLLSIQNHPRAGASANGTWVERYWPWLIRLLYRRADQIVGISSGVAAEVAHLLGRAEDSVPVIYNPVVSPDFDRLVAEESDHPWLREGVPVVVSAGRLTEQKDYPTALRAFARVVRERPARLLIMGRGEDEAQLKQLAADLGIADRVRFMGFVANPFAVMRMARVFLLSSRWEGFANVVAEALACGTPVVSTDCPSGPAEILADGKFGYLAPVGDEAALARGIIAAMDATVDRAALMARGREYSVENLAPRYLRLAQSLGAPA